MNKPFRLSTRINTFIRTTLAVTALVILVGGTLFVPHAHAAGKIFYVSSSDSTASDTNTGLSATTAWKTVERVNTALTAGTITAGDTVYFKRGDTFYTTTGLVMARSGASGSPIVFTSTTSYSGGTGAKPVISGFVPITSGWTSVGTNLWEITAPTNVTQTSTMVMNGAVMPLGRFPKDTAANGGYLTMTYSSTTGNNVTFADSTGSIASLPSLAGAEAVVRPNHWIESRGNIASHSGSTLTLTQKITGSYNLSNGIGFFVQNSPDILTQNGEWAYISSTNKIRLYYAGTPPATYFSSADKVVNLVGFDYLTFSNISFEGGKSYGFYGDTAISPTIDANDIKYSGQYAIYLNYASNIKITNNNIADSQNSGIFISSGSTLANATVTGNTITNTGIRMGTAVPVGGSDKNLTALNISMPAGTNLVQYNKIDGVGNDGIKFGGNNLTIKNNVISNFNLQLDDGGGIYGYGGSNSVASPSVTQYANRVITENVIYNGVGAPYGTISNGRQSSGIYMDLNTNHVDVINNTIFDMANKGMPLNSPQNITISGNNMVNVNNGAIGLCRWMNDGSQSLGGQDLKYLKVTDNAFFNISPGQLLLSYCDFGIKQTNPSSPTGTVTAPNETLATRLRAMAPDASTGTYFFDKNVYRSMDQAVINNDYQNTTAGPYGTYPDLSIQSWKSLSGHDANSTTIPAKTYTVNSTTAALYNNPVDSIAGITMSSTTSSLSLDTTGKLTGAGSAKVTVNTIPAGTQVGYKTSALYGALPTPISSTKKYLVKFSTIGSVEGGMVKVSLWKGASAVLTPYQYASIGTGRIDHEFLFTNPTSSGTTNGNWRIEVFEALGGTYYIDDIQVYEVDATTLNPNDNVVFEYNNTASPRTVLLPAGTYYDVHDTTQATPISGSVTISPYRSTILVKPAGATADTTAPTVSLTAPTAGSTITTGSTVVTATASDNVAVSKVDFYYGTTLIGTDTASPYSATWNVASLPNGAYSLTAKATDSSNNTTTTPSVSVTVSNPDTTAPTVSLTAPTGGTVSATTTLTATASDNTGVTAVDFYYGTTLIASDTTAPYSTTIDTTTLANGTYSLKAIARDAAGNSTTSASVSVTVNNADTTAPTVSLTTPTGGTVSATTTLSANASDNIGVTRVDFYYNSTLIASDTASPYTTPWLTTSVANGTYALKAIAYDAAGNNTTSSLISVIVNNSDVTAPTVSLTAPPSGATLSGSTVTLSATASDNVGVTAVDFYYNSTLIATNTTSPYSASWDTTVLANGSYTLKAIARDAAGNNSTSSLVSVTVSNTVLDTTLPTVSLTAPTAGATLTTTATLTATASDNVAVSRVDFYQGTTLIGTDTSSPYSASWDTTTVANGTYTLKAIATDTSNNQATSGMVSVTLNNTISANTVSITAPVNGSTISGTTAFTATTTGTGITSVAFYKDSDTSPFATTSSLYTTFLDTTTLTNGTHTFKAVASTSTSSVTSSLVTLTINNTTSTGITPNGVTNLIAIPGYTRVKVRWGTPTSNGGTAITSYVVNTTPGGYTSTVAASPSISSGLVNGTPYTFTVQAVNSAGGGVTLTTNSATPSATFTVGGQILVNVSSTLTVRKTASATGTKLGTVANGTVGTVLLNGSGWTKVQFPSLTGWVSSIYIFPNI